MEFNTEKKVVQKAEGNTLPLTVAMFDSDAVFFEHTNSHRVSFLNTHTGKGVTMTILILNLSLSGLLLAAMLHSFV